MKYKNISKVDLRIPNVGIVKAGAVINSKIKINNSNLEEVVSKKEPSVEKNKTDSKK